MQSIKPTMKYETKCKEDGYFYIAGIDEVGRGPWAGPVVAGAVILTKNIKGLKDSKILTEKKRNELDLIIKKMAVDYGIGEASVEEIDKLGIQAATYLAYSRAIDQLKMVDYLLIDGMKWHDCPLPCQAIIKGDSISSSIAAASIIAKVYRDSLMDKLHIELPCYGFDKHKGYGTKFHAESLKMNGISAHHRRSYSPIKQYI